VKPIEKFLPPLEKFVGYILKLLDIVQKIWAPQKSLCPSWRPNLVTVLHCAVPAALIPLFCLPNSLVKYLTVFLSVSPQDFLERNQDVSIKSEVLMTCDIPSFVL